MKLVPWVLICACACGEEARPRPAGATGAVAGDGGGGVAKVTGQEGPVVMTAAAARGRLVLTFENTSAGEVTIATHVFGAAMRNYDWLRVEMEGPGGKRELGFIQDRDESGVVTAELGPGAKHTETIDLIEWLAERDGGPLVPGMYRVTAWWDTTRQARGVKVVATASTTLEVVAPGAAACVNDGIPDPAKVRLRLLARQAKGGRATVDVGLYNAGDVRVCVYTHVKTHEIQNDWLTIRYSDGAKYHHFMREVRLEDDRDKSYPVSVLLEPGQVAWQAIDVDAWARRKRNGSEALPASSLYAQAVYDSTGETGVWAGSLTSTSFELRVP